MIEFEATNLEDLEKEAFQKRYEISIATIKAICKGIEENVDVVSLGFLSKIDMDISVKKDNFIEALELNIGRASEMEEYELCAKAVEYIQILKQKRAEEG
jgi:hypothetical protein